MYSQACRAENVFEVFLTLYSLQRNRCSALHSSRRGWQNLLADFWIFVQIWTYLIVLNIFIWNTSFKVFLNDYLYNFKRSKNLKNYPFSITLRRNNRFFLKEHGVQTHRILCIFFHLPNIKKCEIFIYFHLVEEFCHLLPIELDHCAVPYSYFVPGIALANIQN